MVDLIEQEDSYWYAEYCKVRTALAIEREGHAAARQNFHTMQLAADALRKRADRAEASLAEAKRLLKPFADAGGHFDGHVRDGDLVPLAMRDIRASHVRAARTFLGGQHG